MSATAPKTPRAMALDALRGFAILTMVLSGVVPYSTLPAWMYHAQTPPPSRGFDASVPGVTWVDLVFPFFLFALGAAIPLALSRRLDKGVPKWKIYLGLGERWCLLVAFAFFKSHISPWQMSSSPTTGIWLMALLGFILLFPMYMRFPRSWSPMIGWSLRLGGWIAAGIYLLLAQYSDGTGFSIHRSDIIIILLTHSALAAGIIWMLTRNRLLLRLGSLGFLVALRLSVHDSGLVKSIADFTHIPWLFHLNHLQYLFIVIPGTIIGDMLHQWIQNRKEEGLVGKAWNTPRQNAIAGLMIVFQLVILVGLFTRWTSVTMIVCIGLGYLGWVLVRDAETPTEKWLRQVFGWGLFWLLLGILFDPYEGGIKKDPATMSYYFVTTGLAIFLLIAFTIIGDIQGRKKWLGLLVDNGQNPMIAYVGGSNLIQPLFGLTGLSIVLEKLTPTPWLGFLGGCFITLLVALMVRFFTRRGIFWRT